MTKETAEVSQYDCLIGTHDLRLSAWGPYTKRYMGLSHIPDIKAGRLFDVSVFPALYRRKAKLPNIRFESDYHPWEASPDLSYFCHRHDLEWKNQVYVDVSFTRIDESTCLMEAHCVNNSDRPQNLDLHYLASLHHPPARPYSTEEVRAATVKLPSDGSWIDALKYETYDVGFDDPRASLTPDGWIRGEVNAHGLVDGRGLQMRDGCTVTYRIQHAGDLLLRVQASQAGNLLVSGAVFNSIPLKEGLHVYELTSARTGEIVIRLQGGQAQLDGIAAVPAGQTTEVQFGECSLNHEPTITKLDDCNGLLLAYEQLDEVYGIAWEAESFRVREFVCDDLDDLFQSNTNNHVSRRFEGQGTGHYTNVHVRPIFMEPESELTVRGLICVGNADDVSAKLRTFEPNCEEVDRAIAEARATAASASHNPSGETYSLSQQLMRATTLTNIVYPVRTRGSWIRHSTPGRWWDCLYTWDSGFIGLGLAELDVERSIDNLNAYLTEVPSDDAAFIHHGSMVPVQFFQFLELWNKVRTREFVEFFYPRLRQYYLFFVGRLGSSTTRSLRSNLLKTWDYFYNSGGWDDYPPQVHMHKQGLQKSVAPVVSTAQAIRIARIMKLAATALGEDVGDYDDDINSFTHALQTHSWDEQSGYFGYVLHDDDGNPLEIMRHESGANFNMGLGGASPLVAGICTREQEDRLVAALMDQKRMWCRCGLSTVDQSAPYYSKSGYWNGAVWMPHQWFMWKALLSLGRGDEAYRIASTALGVWKAEVDDSHNCFEHFIVQSGRGAGWHHFSGLSAPVLCWFSAYHKPGTLTVGLDTLIEEQDYANGHFSARLTSTDGPSTAIITLSPGTRTATWSNADIELKTRHEGCFEVSLPTGSGMLVLRPS